MRFVFVLLVVPALVLAACSAEEEPTSTPTPAPAVSEGAPAAKARASAASPEADCPPSAAPTNPPECPPEYRIALCAGPDAVPCTKEFDCWYPNSGDLTGVCPAAALISCHPWPTADGGTALAMRCSQ